jgi:iron complex outermembrane receptor protein
MRGFTDRLSRSILVMIDGRAVYSPLFAGTYWEVQDTFLPDIDRIEVIRGPGGTLWGANAVNGIINIISRRSSLTQGAVAQVGAGTDERVTAALRYGGARGERLHYRAYAKLFDREGFFDGSGEPADDWRMGQAGFRADWTPAFGHEWTLQGDLYSGEIGQRTQRITYAPPGQVNVDAETQAGGGNVLVRWSSSRTRLQAYYDRTRRSEPGIFERRNTVDVDVQHSVLRRGGHQLLAGAGYRMSHGDTGSTGPSRLLPEDQADNLFTAFAQDEIEVSADRLRLTLGAKLEHNRYSGFEAQPSGRVIWTPDATHAVLLSVTRAVRTPSRFEQDFESTLFDPATAVFVRVTPNDAFVSEKLVAYEAGYRIRPTGRLYLTASGFYNHVTDVISTEPGQILIEAAPPPVHLVLPVMLGNGLHGNTHGVEATSDLRAARWLRWTASYSFLRVQLTRDPDSGDASQERRGETLSPRHQVTSQVSADWQRLELDWMFRAAGELRGAVPGYATSDVRLGVHVTRRLDLAVVGTDLHHARHVEFPNDSGPNVGVRRGVSVNAAWRW